jgi:hypothetical protein
LGCAYCRVYVTPTAMLAPITNGTIEKPDVLIDRRSILEQEAFSKVMKSILYCNKACLDSEQCGPYRYYQLVEKGEVDLSAKLSLGFDWCAPLRRAFEILLQQHNFCTAQHHFIPLHSTHNTPKVFKCLASATMPISKKDRVDIHLASCPCRATTPQRPSLPPYADPA